MEIIVQGTGKDTFVPDEAIFTIQFVVKGNSYDEVLQEGVDHVEWFIENIFLPNHFKREDLKTRSFVIKEDQKYNQETGQYVKDGYSFHQMASFTMDYDRKRIANLFVSISKMATPPKCIVHFGIKEEEACRKSLITKAYQDAYKQALAIALASGKTLKDCQKVDFNPFTTNYISPTRLDSENIYMERAGENTLQRLENTFTPEDIVLTETLYCLWVTI